jgi:hypothetical protein
MDRCESDGRGSDYGPDLAEVLQGPDGVHVPPALVQAAWAVLAERDALE